MNNVQDYLPRNKYISHYLKLVEKRLKQPYDQGKSEKHHILPKSLFPEFEKREDNIVVLSIREHYVAHLLLWKGSNTAQMTRAFFFMSNMYKNNSRIYASLLEQLRNLGAPSKGKKAVEKNGVRIYVNECEVEDYLSNGWSTDFEDMTWVKKNGESKRIPVNELDSYMELGWDNGHNFTTNNGRITINKNGKQKHLKDDSELQSFLDDGWTLGTAATNLEGYIRIHNGDIEKMIKPAEAKDYLDKGWVQGLKDDFFTGRVAITNGKENRYVTKDELDDLLSSGWRRGSTRKQNKGRMFVNNGEYNKMIDKAEFDEYSSNGWVAGRDDKLKKLSRNNNIV